MAGTIPNVASTFGFNFELDPSNNISLETTTVNPVADFVVNSTADPGNGICDVTECTLREAITAANTHAGRDIIAFNIAGAGPHTIQPGSALPTIVDPVVIDGYTQPGASPNTNPPSTGKNAVLKIELDGSGAGLVHGLFITAGGSKVRGLAINRFFSEEILLSTNGGNSIEGNFIGSNIDGSVLLGGGGMVNVINSSTGNTIGGTAPGAGNVIAGGILVQQSSSDTTVQGNFIGVDVTGAVPWGVDGSGVFVDTPNNIIGGTVPGARNIISGLRRGIKLTASGAGTLIQGNYIGTDVSGSLDIGHTSTGIIVNSSGNTIGGSAAGAGNVISGNGTPGSFDGYGILIGDGGANNNIQGNYIGTDSTGTAGLGNSNAGIRIVAFGTPATGNIIGGTVPGAGNVISANGKQGVFISGPKATDIILQGNFIGTDVSGTAPLGNALEGVTISTSNITVGGSASGAPNKIAFNGRIGVLVPTGTGNAIRSNSIFSNAGLGIDLSFDGVTANDVGDGDTGANNLQNFPVLTSATSNVVGTDIDGTLNSAANTTFKVEFFLNSVCDPSGYGEGETLLGSITVLTDGGGYASFIATFGTAVPVGQFITATATDPANNTSEFSVCRTVVAAPPPFVVNSTADPGNGVCDVTECTLREAIIAANVHSGPDIIAFNIPGSGTHTIKPASALPTIGGPLVIDGYTQPGAGPNTNPPALGSNATLKIELDGTSVVTFTNGLRISGGGSTVRGLVINRFTGSGIRIDQLGANVIEGNFIGTDVTGTLDLGNNAVGVFILGNSSGNLIGATTPAARNVISGNGNSGININGPGATGNVVRGNFIGTDITGTLDLGNTNDGVRIDGPANNTIGGTTAGSRNVISGNGNSGIRIAGSTATDNVVQGNFIGTEVDGTSRLGNSGDGVRILGFGSATNNTIGGTASNTANIIAFNSGDGVRVDSGTGNVIPTNSIFSNTGLGIDLAPNGVTANDTGDGDTGANNRQNFPVLTSASSTVDGTDVEGTLNSAANTTFRVEFFANSGCDPSGHGEGETFLGSISVLTDGSGYASFGVSFATVVPVGHLITATATDPANNTSEFSGCRIVVIHGFAYVSNHLNVQFGGTPGISVIDLATNSVVKTINVGAQPSGLSVTPGGEFVYVPMFGEDIVKVIDTSTNTVVATITGSFAKPISSAVTPDGKRVYVTNRNGKYITVIDSDPLSLTCNTVLTTVTVAGPTWDPPVSGVVKAFPIDIAITPDGSRAYVTKTFSDVISVVDIDPASPDYHTVIDTVQDTGATLASQQPNLAITPDGTRAYVSNTPTGTVTVIDTDPINANYHTVVSSVTGLISPTGLDVTPDGANVYVAGGASFAGTVTVIDTGTNAVLETIAGMGAAPGAVAILPDGTRVYVADFQFDLVKVIDTSTNNLTEVIAVGRGPTSIAFVVK